ncbi:MAG: hypothetical protein HUK20_06655 [Fibrobacter sp.]|nr:hypothetical protein [Fibrobacter sp.]
MSITVIYSDFGDTDTQVLTNLWKGIPDANLVHVTRDTRDVQNKIKNALVSEKDTLLLCGHGTPGGLLSPTWEFLVGEHNARYIKARRVIGIWCYAAQFAESVGLKGFFSSMFVSNPGEACNAGCNESCAEVITQQEILFCSRVNQMILDSTPMNRWISLLRTQADMNVDVVKFNYEGLRYYA